MLRGKTTPAHLGWALVDVLFCTMIVMIVVTCVAQATDTMSGIAMKNRNMRMSALDYMSLSDEMSVRITLPDDGEFAYGKWKGRKINSGSLSGLAFSDVAVGNEYAGERDVIERFWNIEGRK
jgi:hypothetical protein